MPSIAAAVILFCVPWPSWAGPLEDAVDRIENKVDNANDKLNTVRDRSATIVSDTAGLQGLTSAVSDIRSGLRLNVLDDLIASLTGSRICSST